MISSFVAVSLYLYLYLHKYLMNHLARFVAESPYLSFPPGNAPPDRSASTTLDDNAADGKYDDDVDDEYNGDDDNGDGDSTSRLPYCAALWRGVLLL